MLWGEFYKKIQGILLHKSSLDQQSYEILHLKTNSYDSESGIWITWMEKIRKTIKLFYSINFQHIDFLIRA
jgi:hypothetical protein